MMSEVPLMLFYNAHPQFNFFISVEKKMFLLMSLLPFYEPVLLFYRASRMKLTVGGSCCIWAGGKLELVVCPVHHDMNCRCIFFSLFPPFVSHCLNLHLEHCCICFYYKLEGILCLKIVALATIIVLWLCLLNSMEHSVTCLKKLVLHYGLSKTVFT